MFEQRATPYLFGFILSGLMTIFVSGIATRRAIGIGDGFFGVWIGSWLTSWALAFPLVLVMAPLTRKIVAKLVRP